MIQKYGGKIICIFIPCFQRSSFQLPGIQAPSCQAGMTFGTSSIGFDPADSAQYAAEAAPILQMLGGPAERPG